MSSRLIAMMGALVVVWLAVASPLAHLDHHLLTMHMVQHLVLMLVAAPLILLGFRVTAIPKPHIAICWLAGSLTVIFWHIPTVFELALQSRFWHVLEQASFLIAGILFWRPIMGSSGWSVPVYLFLATLPCDALSAFLAFCGHVVYRPYLADHANMFGLSPLADQELAGALMWVTVTFAYLIPGLVAIAKLMYDERGHSVANLAAE